MTPGDAGARPGGSPVEGAWQESLFGEPDEARLPLDFSGLRHDDLDGRSWVEVVAGWVPDHAALFAELRESAPWAQRSRRMWEDEVLEPRLVAVYPHVRDLPPALEAQRAALSSRYGVEIDSCLVNLYRDGRDAVAWHGDTVRRLMPRPLVFTVSLGARRRFLLRPAGGASVAGGASGRPVGYTPGEGDLVVMGGRCQAEWVHAVPRDVRASGPRISVTFRHSRP